MKKWITLLVHKYDVASICHEEMTVSHLDSSFSIAKKKEFVNLHHEKQSYSSAVFLETIPSGNMS